ncbi:Glycosyltransferase Gtf1 [uncultured archaeon]|nr:Glycosyltransferase Gtf1 [uncultured archaeon]
MSSKLKICILSEFGYSIFTGSGEIVGGSELQMSLLAKNLAKRQYNVFFVTFEKSNLSSELIDDVKIHHAFYNKKRGYTFLLPQNLYKLMKVLNKINADIYIKKGYSPLTGIIAFYALLKNKKFLFIASSDKNVTSNLDISTPYNLKNIFYRYGVKNSSIIVCQTNHQKNLLKQKIGRDGRIIKNLYLQSEKILKQRKSSNLKILWVGRLTKGKRVEIFLKLAKIFPNYNFWMIVAGIELEYFNRIKEAADKIKNLEFIGFVEHNKIDEFYRMSSLLVHTSAFEGFPNTFLEAWGNSIPVISFGFDPDEIICKHGLGIHVENLDDLFENIDILLKNDHLRNKMGAQSRKYVEKEHNLDRILDGYEKLFNEIQLIKNKEYQK